VEDDHELLLGQVMVVRVRSFAGRQLPEAQAEAFAAGLAADTGTPAAEAWMLSRLVELRFVDVWHARSMASRRWPLASPYRDARSAATLACG
jgi:hypothetical protein